MVIIVFFCFYAYLISIIFGAWLLNKINNGSYDTQNPLPFLFGISFITFLGSGFLLFFRISWEFHTILLLSSLICFYYNYKIILNGLKSTLKQLKDLSTLPKFIFITLSFYALIKTILPSYNYDEDLYYIQSIKWMQEYGTVLGLGNLHGRLAYNSAWHTLHTIFSFSFFKIQGINDLNALLFIVFLFHSCIRLDSIIKNGITLLNVLYSLFPLAIILVLNSGLSSMSADFPSAIISWYIIILFIEKTIHKTTHIADLCFWVIIILTTFVITIKVSSFPICILSICLIFKQLIIKKYKIFIFSSFIVIVLIIPFLTRNFMLSGYLVYPAYTIDFFDVEWKIPIKNTTIYKIENAKDDYEWIKSWARIPANSKEYVLGLSTKEWMKIWSNSLTPVNNAILLLIFFSIAFCTFLFKKRNLDFIILAITGIIWFGFWLFNAPDFRFGYSFLVFILLLSLSFIFVEVNKIQNINGIYMILYFILMFNIILTNLTVSEIVSCFTTHFRKPTAPLQTETYFIQLEKNLTVYYPKEGDRCFGNKLPCTYFKNDQIELIGNNISEGFRPKANK